MEINFNDLKDQLRSHEEWKRNTKDQLINEISYLLIKNDNHIIITDRASIYYRSSVYLDNSRTIRIGSLPIQHYSCAEVVSIAEALTNSVNPSNGMSNARLSYDQPQEIYRDRLPRDKEDKNTDEESYLSIDDRNEDYV